MLPGVTASANWNCEPCVRILLTALLQFGRRLAIVAIQRHEIADAALFATRREHLIEGDRAVGQSLLAQVPRERFQGVSILRQAVGS